MAQSELVKAVVLRSVAYGEADRIVTLYTESRGKITLFARHARKSARRFGAALEPYALIEAEVTLGRAEIGRLVQARVLRVFEGVLRDLERMSVAAAGLELVRESSSDRDANPRLLAAVERFFEVVECTPSIDEALLAFTLRVLSLTGLSPNVASCGHCGRAAPESKAALFDAAAGAIVCRACGGGRIKLTGPLRARIAQAATRTWDDLPSETWSTEDRTTVRTMLDELFVHHLPHRLSGQNLVLSVREVQESYARARST